jgi:uncharacterized protein (DUF433 family)
MVGPGMRTTSLDPLLARVTVTPGVRRGQPIIRDTRTTVADILGWLAAGAYPNEILSHFSWLTPEDIKAALTYAAHELGHKAR